MLVRIWEVAEQFEEAGRTCPLRNWESGRLELDDFRTLEIWLYRTLCRRQKRSNSISLSQLEEMTWGCLAVYSYKGLPPTRVKENRLTLRQRLSPLQHCAQHSKRVTCAFFVFRRILTNWQRQAALASSKLLAGTRGRCCRSSLGRHEGWSLKHRIGNALKDDKMSVNREIYLLISVKIVKTCSGAEVLQWKLLLNCIERFLRLIF